MAAPEDKPTPGLPFEIARLLEAGEGYKRDIERLRRELSEKNAQIAELQRAEADNPDLAPLKSLLEPQFYEAARRAMRSETLRTVRRGGRIFTTKTWVDRWLRRTGRRKSTL